MAPLRLAVLAALAGLAACGGQDRAAVVERPPRCVEGTETARSVFGRDDVRVGGAVLMNLRAQQRAPWRELWVRQERIAVVKLPVVVPAGETLTLTVPSQARGILALYYDLETQRPVRVGEGATTVRLSACRGRYTSVGFPGQLLVARPVCRVPLDYSYGDSKRGRLELSFGGACG
jgi:hypothetical protein